MTKKWYSSRMMWVNILGFVASAIVLIQQFLAEGDFTEVALLGLVYALVNLVLRKLTTKKIK
jgi:hypothetical protein